MTNPTPEKCVSHRWQIIGEPTIDNRYKDLKTNKPMRQQVQKCKNCGEIRTAHFDCEAMMGKYEERNAAAGKYAKVHWPDGPIDARHNQHEDKRAFKAGWDASHTRDQKVIDGLIEAFEAIREIDYDKYGPGEQKGSREIVLNAIEKAKSQMGEG